MALSGSPSAAPPPSMKEHTAAEALDLQATGGGDYRVVGEGDGRGRGDDDEAFFRALEVFDQPIEGG